MKRYRSIAILATWFVSVLCAWAQEVIVTVTPTQQVLPPQVLLYLADPGKYFTITLTNTTADVQQVHLGLQLEQTIPSSDLAISTPAHRQPKAPFVVQPNSAYTLNSVEMKKLFDHIPSSEIQCPANLFTNYENGAFGLLPEGTYRAKVTAYRWNNPKLPTPIVVSNPEGGWCTFQVCYKAQAPQFLTPMVNAMSESAMAQVDPLNAQFTWTMPVIACGAAATYTYDFKVVELYPGQQPDVAMDRNPVIYQAEDLLANMCIIPTQIVSANFYSDKTYLAQVTAISNASGPLSYVMLENNGKSTYHPFKFKTDIGGEEPPQQPEPEVKKEEEPEPEEPEKEEEKEEEEEDDDDDEEDVELLALWGQNSMQDSLDLSALYNFRNPKITSPAFIDIAARKQFLRSNIAVAWDEVWHLGGEGQQPDTLNFDYEVQLFNGKDVIDKEAVLEMEPIYTKLVKGTGELTDTIRWEMISEKVAERDYLVLRVKPICTNFDTIAYHYDSLNVVDFAIVESMSRKYFQCSNMLEIENETPTTLSAKDLTGQIISIGEYQLTIDEIKAGKEADTWEGKGRVEWNPLGTTVMVCVKFEDLKINTDLAVFGGTAQTYSNDPKSNNDIVEGLFSDWGIDNLIADTEIPYANQLQSAATDGVKSLAEKIDLSRYYEYVVLGQNVWNAIGSQDIDELYMPIALPEDFTNKSPVNIQITTMKFAATHATMDLIGEFVLPDCDVLKDQILMFGAPRLCISPDRILPESGTLALLSDLTLTDPDSDYDCTFKAPKDLLNPVDGCYVSWHADSLELLGVDVDMTIPELKKDVDGVAQVESPVLNIKASVGDWEDWMVDNISMDPFQAEDLPGWTFTAQNIVYDHSIYRTSAHMGKFPTGYNASKTTVAGDIDTWQGLYIKEISVKMPKSLEFGSSGDKRLKIAAKDMFFDDSGATLVVSADDVLSAKTGKAGGWAFSLDKVKASFIQNNFNDCGFSGKFDVPLLDGKIGYSCQILKVNDQKNAPAGNYAYVFKVQQVDDLKMDFLLATAEFDEKLSYMLVEAVPEKTELKTRVELLLTGDLSIGGDAMKSKMQSMPLSFDLPGIHFSKMRLANCPTWESQFDDIKELQTAKDDTKVLLLLYKGREFNVKNQLYFNTGQWSLASMAKKLGPFELSLDKYNFDYKNELLSMSIEGTVKLIDGLDISATAGMTIMARLSGVTAVAKDFDFSKISFAYEDTKFDKASFGSSFAGMKLSGELTAKEDDTYGKGYKGTLTFVMPGDLFKADAEGGYFEREDYRWGYFLASLGSSTGIQIPPVAITDIKAGFYFNCIRKSETEVEPQKGIIGVVAGLGIASSAGKELLGGDFEMTVVYDNEKDRLTTFMLTGNLKAVSGMINSSATVVYQEDDIDKYFALNITVDAKADGIGGISEKMTALSDDLADMQKTLNANMKEAVSNASGGLQAAFDDNSNSKADSNPGATMPEKPKVGEVSISLDFRVTMKEKGKKLDKAKWHLYLGQPDEDLRCKFILVDFKSKIVSVNIGANAYLCLGNELPGNGELPPIPQKIRQFLDGSTKGSGVQSADMSKANNARTAALKDFQAQVYGGVMMGASAWGYIDVDLGLFYGNIGALAGFDVSIRNIGNTQCMNIPRTPGFNGWYAEGQLYAYLYAKFGIHINLGFWEKKIDIIDAGIGGVLRLGLPNPTYFTGDVRVKLRLLAGLVNINRRFEFECGESCDIFYGNALDNFKLFGDCSIGDTIQAKGWKKENAINPKFYIPPYLNTEAPIEEHFRVLDETEWNRLAKDFNGDKEQLKAQASRTFVFDMNNVVMIYEYSRSNQNLKNYDRAFGFLFKGKSRFQHQINMLELNPNKYYRLRVGGWAKEIENGQEVDPLKWNEQKKKYENVAWTQYKDYFFCTGAAEKLEDCPEDLQKYVAIAYPSYYNELKRTDTYINTYLSDIQSPNIAFFTDISKQAFQKGKLRWKLEQRVNGTWKFLEEKDAYWVTTDSTCNLTVKEGAFNTKVAKWKNYRLQLNYMVSKTVSTTQRVWNANLRKFVDKTVSKIETKTTNIVDLLVSGQAGYYDTGYDNEVGKGQQPIYEKPFVGIRLNKVKMKTSQPRVNLRGLSYYGRYKADDGVNPLRYQDPYTYITYMSNYGLVGGWELTNKRMGVNATTAQSLIYHDRGGSYEGAYKTSYGSMADYNKVKAMSIYDGSQWKNDCQYPLPVMTDSKYNYAIGGRERAYTFNPNSNERQRAKNLVNDLYEVYSLVDKFDSNFRWRLQHLFSFGYHTYGIDFSSKYANFVESSMEANAGVYITAVSDRNPNIRIEVPYYQLGILWGSQFNNVNTRGKVTMWKSFDGIPKDYTRPQEERCEDILLGLIGNYPFKIFDVDYEVITGPKRTGGYNYSDRGPYIDFVPQWNNISEVDVTYYRVNAYNFKKAEYTVAYRAYLNMGPILSRVRCTIKDPSGLVLVKKNLNSYCYYNY